MEGKRFFDRARANQPGIIIRGCDLGQGDKELDDAGTAFLHVVVDDLIRQASSLGSSRSARLPRKRACRCSQ